MKKKATRKNQAAAAAREDPAILPAAEGAKPAPNATPEPAPAWTASDESQATKLKRIRLREQIARIKFQIGLQENGLNDTRVNIKRQTRQIAAGQGVYQRPLELSLQDERERGAKIECFKRTIAEQEDEIKALELTPEQQAARKTVQRGLVTMMGELLEVAAAATESLLAARNHLAACSKLAKGMRAEANKIDFDPRVDFGLERIEAAVRAIPAGPLDETGRFLRWFLGVEPDREAFTVARETTVVFPETLRDAGIYEKGDVANLTLEQRREVMTPPPSEPELLRRVFAEHAGRVAGDAPASADDGFIDWRLG